MTKFLQLLAIIFLLPLYVFCGLIYALLAFIGSILDIAFTIKPERR